jgi:hypothetical protein
MMGPFRFGDFVIERFSDFGIFKSPNRKITKCSTLWLAGKGSVSK